MMEPLLRRRVATWLARIGSGPVVLAALVSGVVLPATLAGQSASLERLPTLPGYAAYARLEQDLRAGPAFTPAASTPRWASDSLSFTFVAAGRLRRFDIASGTAADVDDPAVAAATSGGPSGAAPRGPRGPDPCPIVTVERGRQRACEGSPDGQFKMFSRDRNVFVSRADGSDERQVTVDGSDVQRIKYGVASWVYGEELEQTTAIWWSPDSRQVAFYRFDESRVADYYVTTDLTRVQSSVDVEAYPKAGTDNPIADILVYDLAGGSVRRLDVRDGGPFVDDSIGHYVYAVQWAADGSAIRLNRTNRRQQVMELASCRPSTGECHAIVRESWPTGWVRNRPTVRMLRDERRFIWSSERTGWKNFELRDISGRLITPLTRLSGADVEAIVRVDEDRGEFFYTARDGDNPLKLQLHRVGLDGSGDRRLTDPAFTHTVTLSPDNRWFVDVFQAHDVPPAMRLVAVDGSTVAPVATSDLTRFESLRLRKVEQFSYLAADGATRLLGQVAFPRDFDAAKRYPVLVETYSGPELWDDLPTESFTVPTPLVEFGFLVVRLQTRAAPAMGKAAHDALYLKLGEAEVDDLASGVKALASRAYVDAGRVGIFGTSYGGYAALMALLRYPDLFAAGVASSAPTDWRHYDTIYTERYMWTPQANSAGYDRGSAVVNAGRLRGRLLIYFGTADNNVHPSNTVQLAQALARAGKSFDLQIGPDQGHSAVSTGRLMEFLIEHLVERPDRLVAPAADR